MIVHFEAAILGGTRAGLDRQLRADARAERGIERVEAQAPLGRVERDGFAFDRIIAARAVGALDARGVLL